MSEVPPDASGGKPEDEASSAGAQDEGAQVEEGGPGRGQPRPEGAAPPEWWRIDQESPSSAAQGTPPSGTPPFGAPSPGSAPPFASVPPGAPAPGGTTPPGSPPWWMPGWGVPPWGGAPQWYGWGPGWPSGPPQPPSAPSTPSPPRRWPLPWVIVGGVLAAIAMVALGLGIGYIVWGGSASSVVPHRVTVPFPRVSPFPGIGRGGFLGVEIATSPSTTTTSGAHVVAVVPSSPAAKAGIVKGDTITQFDTMPVTSAPALEIDVFGTAPGTHVKVDWVTSTGKQESATVTLTTRPATSPLG